MAFLQIAFGKLQKLKMDAPINLTKRESEIAERIAWGASQKEVADQLCISRSTVDNTLRKVYEKTGVSKMNELSAWWFCTHFNISFNLSPFTRSLTALCFLVLFLYAEWLHNEDMFCRRCGRGRTRTELVRRTRRID